MKAKTTRDSKKENSILKKLREFQIFKQLAPVFVIMVITILLSVLTGCTQSVSVNYYNPNWLPDGRIIAVKESVGSVQELVNPGKVVFVNAFLVAMDIDGKNETPLFECHPAFTPIPSPDGTKIASSTYIRDLSGQIIEKIPSKDGTRSMDIVDWSPDSKKVLCWAYEMNQPAKYIYTYDLTTKELRYLTEGVEPAWNNEVGITYRDDWFSVIDPINGKIITRNINLVDARLLPDNKTIFGLKGAFEFYNIETSMLINKFHKNNNYKFNFRLSPNQKYIVSTTINGNGVYLTDVKTGIGRFVVTGSTYEK